jgi:hypothetical protein
LWLRQRAGAAAPPEAPRAGIGYVIDSEGVTCPMPRKDHREPDDGFTYQVRFCDIVFRTCATRAEAEEAYEDAHAAWATGGPFDPDMVDGEMYALECDIRSFGQYTERVNYSLVKVDSAGKKHKIRDEDDGEEDEDDEDDEA